MGRSDFGEKRKSYDMAWRNFKKQSADLVRTIEVLSRVRPEGVARSARRAAARDALLPADRKCPVCGIVKLKSRQWVVGRHDLYEAVCKGCSMRG